LCVKRKGTIDKLLLGMAPKVAESESILRMTALRGTTSEPVMRKRSTKIDAKMVRSASGSAAFMPARMSTLPLRKIVQDQTT
jgi:hypothetical protein